MDEAKQRRIHAINHHVIKILNEHGFDNRTHAQRKGFDIVLYDTGSSVLIKLVKLIAFKNFKP